MRDPYKILGVSQDAGAEEIKAAWRSLAKSVHPDQNRDDPDATARFTEIGRAYETLKDPKKRSRLDQLLRMAETRDGSQTIIQQRQSAHEAAERVRATRVDTEKVMEELARARAQQAAEAAQAGGDAAARSDRAKPRASNAGQSAPANESPEAIIERIFGARAGAPVSPSEAQAATTAAVAGESQKRREQPRIETMEPEVAVAESEPVLDSGGIGGIIGRPPLAILGSLVRRFTGTAPALEKAPDVAAEATLTVDDILEGRWIAVELSDGREVRFQATPGISEGHVVRLKGQGLKLKGMQRGDLAITVHLKQPSPLTIRGLDVHAMLPITIENAVLGCSVTVEGPNGPIPIAVPAWSGSDRLIRIEGGGLMGSDGAKGDLIVELRLMLWEKPDDKVTDLMRSMKDGLYL